MLTEEEKQEIIALVLANRPLPEKYRKRLFSRPDYGKLDNTSLKTCLLELHHPVNDEFSSLNRSRWLNSLFWADNLDLLHFLHSPEMRRTLDEAGGIKLIYIDPPFNAAQNFYLNCPRNFPAHPPFAFADIWEDGLPGFLDWLSPRLQLMRELLTPDGLIFVHCDWRLSARLRLLLDDIFSFHVNEIIWHYTGGGRSARFFSRKHDNIFIYAKSRNFNFYPDQIRIPYSSTSSYAKNGINSRAGKKYMPNPLGAVPDDVWDIPIINPLSSERNSYPTQKPEALLERIILSCTKPGDLVADFFCGSGVTGAVAQKLGRKWLLADIGFPAIHICKKRLCKLSTDSSANAPTPFALWTIKAKQDGPETLFPRLSLPLTRLEDVFFSQQGDDLWLIFPGSATCRWEKIREILKEHPRLFNNIFVLASAYAWDCLESGRTSGILTHGRFHFLNLPPFINGKLPLRLQCGPALFPGFQLRHDSDRVALEILDLQWGADPWQNGLVSPQARRHVKNSVATWRKQDGVPPPWQRLLDSWAVDPDCARAYREMPQEAPLFKPSWLSEKSGADSPPSLLSPFMSCNKLAHMAVKITDIFFNESLIFLDEKLSRGCRPQDSHQYGTKSR